VYGKHHGDGGDHLAEVLGNDRPAFMVARQGLQCAAPASPYRSVACETLEAVSMKWTAPDEVPIARVAFNRKVPHLGMHHPATRITGGGHRTLDSRSNIHIGDRTQPASRAVTPLCESRRANFAVDSYGKS
jgi:hypothetical protein